MQTNIVLFHLYEVPRIAKFIESESTLVMPGAGEVEEEGLGN